MGKNKRKQQLKRHVLPTAPASSCDTNAKRMKTKKKHKTQKSTTTTEIQVELDTLSFDDAFSAGLAFEQLESLDGAIAAFQRANKCDPNHLEALVRLADVNSASGQSEAALHCYVQASELEDGKMDASIWFRLGLTYAAMGQLLQATKAYQRSVQIYTKEFDSAKGFNQEDVLELQKAYGITLAALAETFGELGDLNSAVQVFKTATAKFPDNANMHYNLANMRLARMESTGKKAFDIKVVQNLERAVLLSPDTLEFVNDLNLYLVAHDQQPDRVRELKAIAQNIVGERH